MRHHTGQLRGLIALLSSSGFDVQLQEIAPFARVEVWFKEALVTAIPNMKRFRKGALDASQCSVPHPSSHTHATSPLSTSKHTAGGDGSFDPECQVILSMLKDR